MASLHDRGKCTEVFNTSVGAGTKEYIVNLMTEKLLARLKSHVCKRLLERSLTSLVYLIECRNGLSNADTHTRIGAVSDARLYVGSIKHEFLVEHGIVATLQSLPVSHGLVPILALRSIFATLDIFECCLVGSYKSATRTHLDREIAECESALHRHVAYYVACIFNEISGSTRSGESAHQVESYILWCNALCQLSVDAYTHRLRLALQNAL